MGWSETPLFLGRMEPFATKRFPVQIFGKKALLRRLRQKIKQNLLQSACVNGSSESRKAHMKTHGNGIPADLTGAALQNLLPAAADGDQAALAGTLRLKAEPLRLGRKQSRQVVLQRNPFTILIPQFFGKSRQLPGNFQMNGGWGGERIPLHMVNHQHIGSKLIRPGQRFVGRITFMVNGAQHCAQFIR